MEDDKRSEVETDSKRTRSNLYCRVKTKFKTLTHNGDRPFGSRNALSEKRKLSLVSGG